MQNLIDPAILFFIFGVLAGTVKSNLEIPPAISRFLSLYLLMALGLKGGFALSQSGLTAERGHQPGCSCVARHRHSAHWLRRTAALCLGF